MLSFLVGSAQPIKLEIINFSNSRLLPEENNPIFPIACVGRIGCFATKLTANADRYKNHRKDILDICMMRNEWGDIPRPAWEIACEEYGESTIYLALKSALRNLHGNANALKEAVDSLKVESELAEHIIYGQSKDWLDEIELIDNS